MYHSIFGKSFSRYDRKRFRCFALILSFTLALSVCSTFKPTLHPLKISTLQELFIDDDIRYHSAQTAVSDGGSTNPQTSTDAAPNKLEQPQSDQTNNAEPLTPQASNDAAQNNTTAISEPQPEPELPHIDQKQNAEKAEALFNPQSLHDAAQSEAEIELPQIVQKQNVEPLCRALKRNADYCEFEGDVRVDSNSSTVFLIRPRSSISDTNTTSWTIQPYPRKGMASARHWTVRVAADDGPVPKCDKTHHLPALLFSIGGFSGNYFHDFANVLVPLFTTSLQFKKEVHFLASHYKRWWRAKYRPLLDQLTRHDILDIDRESNVHCYTKIIAGLKFHGELVVDSTSSGVSMQQFRQLLRRTYSLDRKKASPNNPRLLIVSRNRTRILTNEEQVSRQARKLGYEVVSAEGRSTNLTKFAQLVNSCDVMMGVHGAGLTNMVFLPENAVLIQVVPLSIDIMAKLDFGNPTAGMNIRYLDYKIEMKESSLFRDYPIDHPVLRDPLSIHREGWGKLRDVYLNNQNVTIDVRRFRATLAKALKLLRR